MNCANHPEIPVTAYCQNCGKPLCTQCTRSVAGVVYCEPCLAARLQSGTPYTGSSRPSGAAGTGGGSWSTVPNAAGAPFVSATPYATAPGGFGPGASPVLAGLLGAIPGVGAMYNGQFIKALVHVLVFIVLIGLTDRFDLAGLLIAAWIFYQIFDAIQTAVARRNGQPLPDPFGLNDLGTRMGVPPAPSVVYPQPPVAGSAPASGPAQAGPQPGPVSGYTSVPMGQTMGQPAYTPVPAPVMYAGRPEPVGAVVLIVVGTLFLLSTLGLFRLHWIGHSWPLLIIFIGAWTLFSRVRSGRQGGGL